MIDENVEHPSLTRAGALWYYIQRLGSEGQCAGTLMTRSVHLRGKVTANELWMEWVLI